MSPGKRIKYQESTLQLSDFVEVIVKTKFHQVDDEDELKLKLIKELIFNL